MDQKDHILYTHAHTHIHTHCKFIMPKEIPCLILIMKVVIIKAATELSQRYMNHVLSPQEGLPVA